MYSGTTLTPWSGRILGAHQKFDRLARGHLEKIIPDNSAFPRSGQILHFEGRQGPDAIKRKSPAKDEPWHFYSPFNDEDGQILELIQDHYDQLVKELKNQNQERIAFEAAWLAHALVDGLTPAHHYPYKEELSEIRGGESNDTRDTIRKKLMVQGDTRREKLKNNWKVWGPKGLLSTHSLFEVGVAAIIAPLTMSEAIPSQRDIRMMQEMGPKEWFKRTAREIAVLDMYERYHKRGWTTKLIIQVRQKLGPLIVKTVTLTWYAALIDAGLISTTE